MQDSIISFFQEDTTDKYFFTTSITQKNVDPSFILVTIDIPQKVVPIPTLPNGIIRNKEDVRTIYLSDAKEILNPDSTFQA